MNTTENGRIYTEQLNIRLRPEEKQALETQAAERGRSLGEWSRETLLQACAVTPEARKLMLVTVMGTEINRLTLMAVQDQLDLSSDSVRQEIERQASTQAAGILDRWLSLRGAR